MTARADARSAPHVATTVALTLVAMLAFAANSLLCRLALGQGLIDPASFAAVRVVSGAILLGAIVLPGRNAWPHVPVNRRAVAMLLVYVVFFSFAYLSLNAGTGALILFGAVQITMFAVAFRSGERFSALSWVGFAIAVLGLVYLVSPGLAAPDPVGAGLMTVAGVAWGGYTLLGRGVADVLQATASNFILAAPFAVLVSLLFFGGWHGSWHGVLLAVVSGALASGLGYVVWYAALRGLTAARAATVQLSVPVIAAIGGVVLLAEPLTPRLAVASVATLGGIWMVLAQRTRAGRA